MNYFGFTVGQKIFLNDESILKALNIKPKDEFEPNSDNWLIFFNKLKYLHDSIEFKRKIGLSFHFTIGLLELISNLGLINEYKTAFKLFKEGSKLDIENSVHGRHQDKDIILNSDFNPAIKKDLKYSRESGINNVVLHFPIGEINNIDIMVDEIISNPLFYKESLGDIILCWENKADYQWKRRFFGSLKSCVEFKEKLDENLKKSNRENEIINHNFCFDTGHLLVWLGTHENKKEALDEIEIYLPEFAKYVKTFHIHTNDGINDLHITPFSQKYLAHPSRKSISKEKLNENSDLILSWLKIANQNSKIRDRFFYLEAMTNPFTIEQYIEFGKKLKNIF